MVNDREVGRKRDADYKGATRGIERHVPSDIVVGSSKLGGVARIASGIEPVKNASKLTALVPFSPRARLNAFVLRKIDGLGSARNKGIAGTVSGNAIPKIVLRSAKKSRIDQAFAVRSESGDKGVENTHRSAAEIEVSLEGTIVTGKSVEAV